MKILRRKSKVTAYTHFEGNSKLPDLVRYQGKYAIRYDGKSYSLWKNRDMYASAPDMETIEIVEKCLTI